MRPTLVTVLVVDNGFVDNGYIDNNTKTRVPRDMVNFRNITEWWNVTSAPLDHLGMNSGGEMDSLRTSANPRTSRRLYEAMLITST